MAVTGTDQLQSLRRMMRNVGISLVLFAVVVALVLPLRWTGGPGLYLPLALSVISIGAVPLLGRLKPLPIGVSDAKARNDARNAFVVAMFRQMAGAQAPALAALAGSFVEESMVPYLICGAVSVILFFGAVYPSDARIARAERKLDSEGGHSELRATLASPPSPTLS
ncbi:MAG: hypothetical protein HOV77_05780 [Hamadaea sp.]|uniref:hypothetical protein n=1 Tax=Hamadaea sp. TaxID=2024425 RepID=UPI001791487E|nr:hypothetical protein [Hamadaea sp.]NUT18674.1 hypothetical protein [Hamadaea sp.]